MSTTTAKFGFVKPDGTDVFDKDKFLGGNWDAAESQIYSKTESDNNYAKKNPTNTYTNATFQNGFVTLGLSSGDPKYMKTDSNVVYIKGSCGCPASGFSNVAMFTLPVGFRPSSTLNFTLGAVTIGIFSSGQVQYTSASAGNVQFGCISFPAEL